MHVRQRYLFCEAYGDIHYLWVLSILVAYEQNPRRTMLLHADFIRQWVKEEEVIDADRGF